MKFRAGRGSTRGSLRSDPLPRWYGAWLRDSGVNLASQALITVMTTALAVIIARSLEPSELGVFYALFGLSQALAYFVNFGMATWLLRELTARSGRARDEGNEVSPITTAPLVNAVLGANLALSVGLLVTSLVALVLLGRPVDTIIGLTALMTYSALIAGATVIETVFRAERRVGRVAAVNGIEKVVLVAVVAATASQTHNIALLGLSYVVAGALRYAIDVRIVSRQVKLRWPEWRAMTSALYRSAPIGMNTAALFIVPRIDTLIVTVSGTTAAAFFALGDRVVSAMIVVPLAATSALYPFLAGRRLALRTVGPVVVGLGLAGALIAGPVIAVLPDLIPALFGAKYSEALDTIRIMVCALPFLFMSGALMTVLYSAGLEKSALVATTVTIALGSVAIFVGAMEGGAPGAAFGYLFRQALLCVALVVVALCFRSPGGTLNTPPAKVDVVTQSVVDSTT